MGHHRRQASSPGWLARVARWWRYSEALEMQRKADEALETAKDQRRHTERAADVVDRALRAFESRPRGRPT